MGKQNIRGFSLVELMIVMVIIAIFAAVAIPQLIEKSRSNELTDMTNMVQQAVSNVRTAALNTRRAAVLEYDGTNNLMWVNIINGADCWDAIDERCVRNVEADTVDISDQTRRFNLRNEDYFEAGVFFCAARMSIIPNNDPECSAPTDLPTSSSFALCYSGSGDLWVRDTTDPAAACEGTVAPLQKDAWTKACAYRTDTTIDFDGVVLRFNRFEPGSSTGGSCAADGGAVEDVTRTVFVPSSGAPFSRVGN